MTLRDFPSRWRRFDGTLHRDWKLDVSQCSRNDAYGLVKAVLLTDTNFSAYQPGLDRV